MNPVQLGHFIDSGRSSAKLVNHTLSRDLAMCNVGGRGIGGLRGPMKHFFNPVPDIFLYLRIGIWLNWPT